MNFDTHHIVSLFLTRRDMSIQRISEKTSSGKLIEFDYCFALNLLHNSWPFEHSSIFSRNTFSDIRKFI